MRGKNVFILILVLFSLSCSEDDSTGILDNQVERLLSGQTGTKTWDQVINTTNCSDSLKFTFELITNSSGDSLDITQTVYQSDCSTQDSFLGRASASAAASERFTDSLVFATGDYWIITEITSQRLQIQIDDQSVRFSSGEN